MDWAGWAVFGLLATALLTAVMIAAQLGGLSRLDLPLILGTVVTPDPDRARAAGSVIHLLVGQGFALGYAATFALLGRATWWLGALLGLLHGAVALTVLIPMLVGVHPRMASERAGPASTAVLEPPGSWPSTTARRHRWSPSPPTSPTAPPWACSSAPDEKSLRRPSPIEDYGLLGDTRTAALVGSDGSVDWLCIPRFDGQPVFGRLVGGAAAGRFRLGPHGPVEVVSRRYRPESATLETTWQTDTGRLTLTEGMVAEVSGRLLPATLLVRRLTALDGPVEAVIDFDPRLGERHRPPRAEHRGEVLVCSWSSLAVGLRTSPVVAIQPGEPQVITVTPDQPFTCVMSVADREPLVYVDPDAAWAALREDEARWQAWCRRHRPATSPTVGSSSAACSPSGC